MSDPKVTPLEEIKVSCRTCGFSTTLDRINADTERFYHAGCMIRISKPFLTEEEQASLRKKALICENCEDDRLEDVLPY